MKEHEVLTRDQRDRDRLGVLKKAQKKLIRQAQAVRELGVTVRHFRRMLKRLKKEGDKAAIHTLRDRLSNRKREEKTREKIVQILSEEVYRGSGRRWPASTWPASTAYASDAKRCARS